MECTRSPERNTVLPVRRVRRPTRQHGLDEIFRDHLVEAITNCKAMDGTNLKSSCDQVPADAHQQCCSAEPEALGNGGSSGDRPSDPQTQRAPPTCADGTTHLNLLAGCSTDSCDSRSWWSKKRSVTALKLVTVCETDYGQGEISGFPSGS